ncbi:MAG: metallophosphoesterase [Desulfovibrio desulfuricans]|nr:metallophosphoesterase [Desulfovibrio desulfuricans]
MAIYLISDTHFGHEKILRYCRRPFQSVFEMNECMFDNWASCVRQNDTVYHLGDVAFGGMEDVVRIVKRIRTLPGKKFLIPGNHDMRHPGLLSEAFTGVLPPIFQTTAQTADGKAVRMVLCHYPMMTWNMEFSGAIQLYGHVHGRIPGNTRQMDMGVDVWDFRPARLEQVLLRMAELPEFKSPEIREEDDQEAGLSPGT